MGRIVQIFILFVLFTSCKMNELYLSVIEPAPVTIPQYIRNIGVIDRSIPAEADKNIDAIDKALSLESATLDKEGAAASVAGLADELKGNSRFDEVLSLPSENPPGMAMGLFPPPLKWEYVDDVCRKNKIDAIFTLEMFDTDTKVSYQMQKGNPKTLLGAVTGIEHQANMVTTVKTGWRIYDPQGRIIIDEYGMSTDLNFSATGLTAIVAASALTDRKEAVKQTGNNAGREYAMRLLPYQIRVDRDYFVKGTDNFKIAKRKAQTGNWDQAGELWQKETQNPDGKIAGRACYNMAIISEINGDLETSIEWAEKAYEDYNTKQALDYLGILRYRINASRLAEEQQK